jgi:plastocyanin domain-containing protein
MVKGRLALVLGMGIVLGLLAWGCGERAGSGPRTVKMTVTDEGFVPAEIKVRAGERLTLLVTRRTDATCAREIVIAGAGIHQDLPLNQEVRIDLTPEKPGELRYACGMDMIAGTLKVE